MFPLQPGNVRSLIVTFQNYGGVFFSDIILPHYMEFILLQGVYVLLTTYFGVFILLVDFKIYM